MVSDAWIEKHLPFWKRLLRRFLLWIVRRP